MPSSSTPIPLLNLPVLFDGLHLSKENSQTLQLIAQIDALLPQTQCGLCGYHDGCLPYAHAVATAGEAANLCVPGGDDTSAAIAKLVNQPIAPAQASQWAIDPITRRPIAMRAVIDESACIGCTKCLPACPVDAIIGTAKHMHSVISPLCTGCQLCLAPCPVDCIDMVPADSCPTDTTDPSTLKARYHAHLNRLSQQIHNNTATVASHTQSKIANQLASSTQPQPQDAKTTIAAAQLRSQIKKLTAQLAHTPNPTKQQQLQALIQKLADLEQNDEST